MACFVLGIFIKMDVNKITTNKKKGLKPRTHKNFKI